MKALITFYDHVDVTEVLVVTQPKFNTTSDTLQMVTVHTIYGSVRFPSKITISVPLCLLWGL